MKKNFLTKVMALGMAMVMALTPVRAEAAEKKVVTYEEYMKVYTDAVTKSYESDDEDIDGVFRSKIFCNRRISSTLVP